MDLLLIGAGPANLSLAALATRRSLAKQLTYKILDKKTAFSWHSGQLINETELQNEWYRDLVTIVDPTNEFSFANYLHEHGRLVRFINSGIIVPTRVEFEKYLAYVALSLGVQYVSECIDLKWSKRYDRWLVTILENEIETTYRSKYVSLALGQHPTQPIVSTNSRIKTLHVSEYSNFEWNRDYDKVLVVGSGQSGAEVVLDIIQNRKELACKSIVWTTRDSSFRTLDTGHFAREFYSHGFTEKFFNLSKRDKEQISNQNKHAAQGISPQTAERLYKVIYDLYVESNGANFLELRTGNSVEETNLSNVKIFNQWNQKSYHEKFNLVIFCTGFKDATLPFVSKTLGVDNIDVNSDFSLNVSNIPSGRLFLQSSATASHGFGQENYVMAPQRNAVILNSIFGRDVYALNNDDMFLGFNL